MSDLERKKTFRQRPNVAGDLRQALLHPATFVVWAVLSSWLVLSGPFSTYEGATVAERALNWPALVALGLIGGIWLRLEIRRRYPAFSYWQVSTATAGGIGTLLAIPGYLVTANMAAMDDVPDLWRGTFTAFWAVVAVAMGLAALRSAFAPRQPSEAPALPALLDRLSPENRGPVVRLSSSDHYVQVVTTAGQEAILIRLADAIAELNGTEGLQVHRSHWVARGAVTGHVREKGRLFLLTSDGARVPVSRSYRADVEAQLLSRDEAERDTPAAR